MSNLRPWEETHRPTAADFQTATNWQLLFEESDLLRDAIWKTERCTGVSFVVSNHGAYYNEPNNEIQSGVDLGIQVNTSLQSTPNDAYSQIAKGLHTLGEELSLAVDGNGGRKTNGDVLERDETGQTWHETISLYGVLGVAALLGAVLFASAIHWLML